MIPLLTKLLGGRWRCGGHSDSSIKSHILSDEIAIPWHIEDVQDIRPDLNDKQARDVLWHCRDSHDALIGINWDVLHYWADDLYPLEEEATP